ncbi:unnamed protein product [Paramecium sonneborni]|uniref:DoxX family protein n=1 Tax=Paramecium sonneborni TaxID=65129 RepID=A0A8S1LH35_9CILI|nr:unnamed protein product [Paramecium sonneborni]
MSCCSFIGRVLLVVIFIGAGVDKLMSPQNSVALLNGRYPGFYKFLDSTIKQYNVQLPDQLQPEAIKKISTQIIQGVGVAEIFLSFFVILNYGWAGKLLFLLTSSFIVIIHNPLIHGKTQDEKLSEQIQALWTLGIAGALLIIGASPSQVKAPVPASTKGKGVAPTAPSKKAKRN